MNDTIRKLFFTMCTVVLSMTNNLSYAQSSGTAKPRRPNVIVILSDDAGFYSLTCNFVPYWVFDIINT